MAKRRSKPRAVLPGVKPEDTWLFLDEDDPGWTALSDAAKQSLIDGWRRELERRGLAASPTSRGTQSALRRFELPRRDPDVIEQALEYARDAYARMPASARRRVRSPRDVERWWHLWTAYLEAARVLVVRGLFTTKNRIRRDDADIAAAIRWYYEQAFGPSQRKTTSYQSLGDDDDNQARKIRGAVKWLKRHLALLPDERKDR